FLTLLSKEENEAIALLERGIAANPGDPLLMEELGMIYYIDKKDTTSALKWLQAALEHDSPNTMLPGFVARIAEGTGYDQEVGKSLARQMKRYQEAGDHRMEAALREKLREHTARIALHRLTRMVERLLAGGATKTQLTIETLQQACHATERLPAGFFQTAGGFWYDPATGDVESFSLAPAERERRTRRIEYLIAMFRQRHDGRLPADPAELEAGAGEPLPHHPLRGWSWEWDPATGVVSEKAP
ncbi:MAG: tetratricopeptide repeat protein, partial [Planctomycetota bacterium]